MIYRNLHTRWPGTPYADVGMKCDLGLCLLYEPDFNEHVDYSVQRIVMFVSRDEKESEEIAREFFKRTVMTALGFDVTHTWIRANVPTWIKGVVAVGEPEDVIDFALGLKMENVEAAAYTYRAIALRQDLLYFTLKAFGCEKAGEVIREYIAPKIKKFVTESYVLRDGQWVEGGFDFLRTFGVGTENEIYIDEATPVRIGEELGKAFNMLKDVINEKCPGIWNEKFESTLILEMTSHTLGTLLGEFKNLGTNDFLEAVMKFFATVDIEKSDAFVNAIMNHRTNRTIMEGVEGVVQIANLINMLDDE